MPATESTWRNIKLLHVVFGVSSIAMLLVTIWMFVADHNRPWKEYQLQTREIDAYYTDLRTLEQNSAEYHATLTTYRGDVAVAQANDWYNDPKQFTELLDLVDQAKPLGIGLKAKTGIIGSTPEVKTVLQEEIKATSDAKEKLLGKLAGLDMNAALRESVIENYPVAKDQKPLPPEKKAEIKAAYDDYLTERAKFLATYEDLIKQVKFAEDNLSGRVKSQTAAQGKAAADRDQAIGRGAKPAEIDQLNKIYDEETAKLQGGKTGDKSTGLVQQLQETKALREEMQRQLASLLAPETTAKKTLADHENKVGQLEKLKYEQAGNFWKTILAAPILSAFGSDIQPKQLWLPDLYHDQRQLRQGRAVRPLRHLSHGHHQDSARLRHGASLPRRQELHRHDRPGRIAPRSAQENRRGTRQGHIL